MGQKKIMSNIKIKESSGYERREKLSNKNIQNISHLLRSPLQLERSELPKNQNLKTIISKLQTRFGSGKLVGITSFSTSTTVCRH